MAEPKNEVTEPAAAEIEVTQCPDCGTAWEVVVTEHPRRPAGSQRRER